METLETRIQSFIKARPPYSNKVYSWPHPDSFVATPKSLAEAGFYFNPSKDDPDNVVCFLCGKELGGWDDTDDPFEIHVQKCPKCPWVLVRCALESDFDSKGKFATKDVGRHPTNKNLEKARLDTYGGKSKWWPHDSKKKHGATSKKMAKAGFVYTPQERGDDTATCFYCDLALSGWDEDDDPLVEHRKRELRSGKHCPFLSALSDPVTSASTRSKPGSSVDLRASQTKKTETIPQTRISNESDDELTIEDVVPVRKRKTATATGSRQIIDQTVPSQPASQNVPSKSKSPERSNATRGTRKSTRRAASDNEEKAEEASTKKSMPRSARSTRQNGQNRTKGSANKGKEKMATSEDEVNTEKPADEESPSITTGTHVSQLSPIVEDISYHAGHNTNAEAMISPPDPLLEPVQHQTLAIDQLEIDLKPPALTDDIFDIDIAPSGMDFDSSMPDIAPLAAVSEKTIMNLSEEERAMTVEEWIRHEIDLHYEQLKLDGENKIEAFKQRAREIRARIAAM